ncbi:uncharacterized protein LOC115737935 [Rhodamnia argentea]|uniref:Uncharacterized protein LOC115737935 n=1 Tax=Rhodamnia argentea TaxID=178133 RepID=A0A8B8NUL8_9MYRT|nr:uncharacterized protein LOC115737935 [Rhodamnia argentea]XP_030526226.1 uncharacterized protein LOC115737935 [Rhodamnia argentea]XP_030526227.1 uncharacterized protein LOC115737935 [Rhodamnia argentea]XP_048140336.1 uncharacterized protein LOC115737935 [Rhodamnia argentea]
MPKDRIVRSIVDHRSSVAPYPCSSQHIKLCESNNPVDSAENIREWEETRCPICMEHPHNAVLLICSSQEKGCRPYMCNTSHRHSNCLDQFYRSPVPSPSTALPQQVPPSGTIAGQMISSSIDLCGSGVDSKLVCPFCRGKILGWVVSEAARQYMNSKPRSCSLETCTFTGTYSELRKHARCEHPYFRPSEVDPSRRRDWTRLEQETELEDFRSTLESAFLEDEMDGGQLFMAENGSLDQMPLFEGDWSFNLSWALSVAEIVNQFLLQSFDQSHRQMRSQMPVQRTPRGRYGYESNGSARRANDFSSSRGNVQRLRWRDHRWSASSNRG